MPIGPTDPINTNDINEIRVGVLGRDVDDSNPHWTTPSDPGPASRRNVLNVSSGEKIVNRAINALDAAVQAAATGTNAFADRFNAVVGDEGGPDQTAFGDIGKNLIQAVHNLKNETPSLAQQGMWNMGIASAATHQQDPDPHVTATQKTDWTNRITALENAAGGGVTLAGDVTGSAASTLVTAIRGRSIPVNKPEIGQILYWAAARPGTPSESPQPEHWAYLYRPQVASGTQVLTWDGASSTINPSHTPLNWQQPEHALKLTGDVSLKFGGTSTSATVRGLQGRDVASTTPVAGDVLGFRNASWTPTKVEVDLAGDVTGSATSTVVSGIGGHPIGTQPTPGVNEYRTLVWFGAAHNRWEAQILNLRFERDMRVADGGLAWGSSSGLGGSFTLGASVTVFAIQNSSVSTERPTDGQVLTWVGGGGRESWGSSTNGSWTPKNLLIPAFSAAAPSNNQALYWNSSNNQWTPDWVLLRFSDDIKLDSSSATLSGDTAAKAITVVAIQKRAVSTATPYGNQALYWNGATSEWTPEFTRLKFSDDLQLDAIGGSTTLSGDNSARPVTVVAIQKRAVVNTQPTHGQVLTWEGGAGNTGSWTPKTAPAFSTATPSASQALYWNGTNNQWTPEFTRLRFSDDIKLDTSGGSTTLSGDTAAKPITVIAIQKKAVSNATPSANQALYWNGTNNQWTPEFTRLRFSGDLQLDATGGSTTLSGDTSAKAVTVTAIRNQPVVNTQPTDGQVLTWQGTSPGGSWTPRAPGGVTFQAIVDALPAGQFSADSLRWRLATVGTPSLTAQPAGWEIGRVMPVGNQHGDLLMWSVPGITTNTPSPVGEGYWTNVLMRPDATPSSTTPADGSMLVWRNLSSPSYTMPDRGWPGRFVLASQTVDTTYTNVLINEQGLKGAASVTAENPGRQGNVILGSRAMVLTPGTTDDIAITGSVVLGQGTYVTPRTKDASRAVFTRSVVLGAMHRFDLTGRNEDNVVIGTGTTTGTGSYWRTKGASYNTLIGAGNILDCGSTGIGDTGPDNNIIIASYSSLHADRTGVIESGLMPVARDNILIGRDLRLFTDGTVLMASSVTVRNILIGSASSTDRMSHTSPHGRILLRGSDCIGIGWRLENYYLSGSTAPTNMITIGSGAKWYGNNTAHIGNSQLATISYGAATGTAFTNRSDARLKENIHDADVDRCLADIDRLKVKRFNYRPCVESDRDHTVTGFLAQDFGNVFPKAMFKNEFNNRGVRIDDCLSTDTSQLVPTLVAAVQALSAQVRALTRHNASETLQ